LPRRSLAIDWNPMVEPPIPTAVRFRTAAPHYLKGRPPYSPRLIERVARICGLNKAHRVMDLGCGPGQLAVALSPYVGEVVALDPEPSMLRVAADHAAQAGAAIRFVEGSSNDLGPELGTFRMVAIGRAFHWMDRERTLARLDDRLEDDGAVALFRDRYPDVPDNAWRQPYKDILEEFAAGDTPRIRHRPPEFPAHEAVLLASTFCRLERVAAIDRQSTSIEAFVDRAFSMSSTAPGRLGARAELLASQVRELMATYAVDGSVSEVVETEALIAHRGLDCAP